jgi:membrane protease YdiL (CAAX protease family)
MLIDFFKNRLFKLKSRGFKDLGSPGKVIILTLTIFIVTQFLAYAIAETLLYMSGDTSLSLDQSVGGQFIYVLMAEVLALAMVLKIVRGRGLNLSTIGLGRKPTWKDAQKAATGFVAFYVLLFVVSVVVGFFLPNVINSNQPQQLGFNNLNGAWGSTLAFLALVILPPFGEEPLVRGYLYSGLRSRWSLPVAMVVTSLIFGLAHLELGSGSPPLWAAGIDTFVLSIVLVKLRDSTGALYAGMLVHMLNNAVAFGVHYR